MRQSAARNDASLTLIFLTFVLAMSLAFAACSETSSGSGDPDTSSVDVGVDTPPNDVIPEATPGETSLEVEAPTEVVIDGVEVQSPPVADSFVFEKAPWLLNPFGETMTVAWQSDVQLVNTVVAVEGVFEGAEPELRYFFGRSSKMDMAPPDVPGVPLLPVTAPAGYQNRVVVEGLLPGEVYDYRVLNAEGDQGGSFRAAPGLNDSTIIAAYGDSRSDHDAHQRVAEAIAAEAPDLLLHSGDMVNMSSADTWQTFFDIISSTVANAPIIGAIGNHESDLLRAWFFGYFNPPTGFEDGTSTSFAYGPAYVIVVNYLRDPTRAGFLEWLEAELVKAEAYPYRFMIAHGPMHTFSNHAPWLAGAEHIEPLLKAHGVQAVFTGHNHCYEHFLTGDLHHFTLGGGGAPLYGISQHTIPGEEQWLIAEGKFYHYMLLELGPDKGTVTIRQVTPTGVEDFETIVLSPAF